MAPLTSDAPPQTIVQLDISALRQAYNTARIPGDSGTRFSLRDLIGSDAGTNARLMVLQPTAPKHGLRLILAPLRTSGTGSFANPVTFEGRTFSANTPTTGVYQFNSWRLGYYSQVRTGPSEQLRLGGTLKVRDALISLRQGTTTASSYNLGVVPLVDVGYDRQLGARWSVHVDADGLAAPQGRAFDISLVAAYALQPSTQLTVGVRTLEGGADNDRVYNFARLDYLSIGVRWRP